MKFLYDSAIFLTEKLLPASKIFSGKMKLFVDGRKEVFSDLKKKISTEDKIIWFHAASLGEYEQAVPVIEAVKSNFPNRKILVSFFSPSGYENKKNSKLADFVTYLPLDTKKNAENFIELVQPEMAFFMKYEVWPNYLQVLQNKKIDTYLVSANFRRDQAYFKAYGGFLRKSLHSFKHIFVQEESSRKLLAEIGIKNVSVSGDTRFDRVSRQLEMDNEVNFISEFKNGQTCVVVGSSWPEDEELLIDYINDSSEEIKWIIAPHALKQQHIQSLKQSLNKKTLLFSEMKNLDLEKYQVFIVDTIGYLSRIYSYADIAYVGGAAGNTGLHNILEPATFGVPIVIGKNFKNFPEAKKLQELGGLFSISKKEELKETMAKLLENTAYRREVGGIAGNFIAKHTGATGCIMDHLLHENK